MTGLRSGRRAKSRGWAAVVLAATSLLVPTAAAEGKTDYSKNAATGEYTPPPSGPAKDYSKNAATGDYAPAETPSAQVVTVADDGGFAWDEAAIGANVALALGALAATTVIRRRRVAWPATHMGDEELEIDATALGPPPQTTQ
jgi:hypothetical protein